MVDHSDSGTESVLQLKTTIISSVNTLPDYYNPTVLHQKYVVEGLSLRQIADQFLSSKTAVLDGLKRFNIPLRQQGRNGSNQASLPFGKRRLNGKVVTHQAESRIIESIKRMRFKEGLSYLAIARILTEMKVPTKKQGKAWHHEMIRSILKREGLIDKNGKEIKK